VQSLRSRAPGLGRIRSVPRETQRPVEPPRGHSRSGTDGACHNRANGRLVELGEGSRPLLFLAHYDTQPGTPGAFRNASGVTMLLGLLARLQGWEAHPLIVGFLDGDELDGAGCRHCHDVLMALGVLTRLRGVLYPRRSGAFRSGHDAGPAGPRESAAPRADRLRARARGAERRESAMTRCSGMAMRPHGRRVRRHRIRS
jgi:hypothetical protein